MKGYVAFAWAPSDPMAVFNIDNVRRRLAREPSWSWVEGGPGLALALEGPRPLAVRPIGSGEGWVLGDLYERKTFRPAPPEPTLPARLEARAEVLLRSFWGRYVAIWADDDGPAVLRDPSGALDAVGWRSRGVDIIASGAPPHWMGAFAPHLRVNWDAVAAGLLEPLLLSETLALEGVTATPAGGLWRPRGRAAARRLWTPAAVVRAAEGRSADNAAACLEHLVDGCVGALARSAGRLASELSGGLDSSIVGSALRQASCGAPAGWINVFAEDPESDERAAARLVHAALGGALTELAKPAFTFTAASLEAQPVGLRPSLNALDHAHDQALAAFCAEAGATALVTGQGGDAVFLQVVTPWALAERGAQGGLRAWVSEATAIARSMRQSIWRVGWQGAGAALGFADAARPPSPYLSRALRDAGAPSHPWLRDVGDIPAAKRLHIRALAYAQMANGESLRGRAADLIHPLLAQPIVEFCLARPVFELTAGGRGRALARRAFQSRLPGPILARRAKGDLTAHYGRAIAGSLAVLRPFLLEGRLAEQGLLDRSALDEALQADQLIWRGGYADILRLMVMEIWVRRWARAPGPLASVDP